jgi:hypothetical protein
MRNLPEVTSRTSPSGVSSSELLGASSSSTPTEGLKNLALAVARLYIVHR